MKVNIGSTLALYPTPVTVVGAQVQGKPNWMIVAHIGILGHDQILISCAKSHYTNQGILENGRVSVNLVDEALLPLADQAGCQSGHTTDKSTLFDYEIGAKGGLLIQGSPLVMECTVVKNIETEGFDNFILKIDNTYAEESVLTTQGKLDYDQLKPVLFEMPTYQYLRCGGVIGKCMTIGKEDVK